MSVRLFRLYDENEQETGFGLYQQTKQRAVFCHKSFRGYKVENDIGTILLHTHAFRWCCPNANAWHGHAVMNNLAEEHTVQVQPNCNSITIRGQNFLIGDSMVQTPSS